MTVLEEMRTIDAPFNSMNFLTEFPSLYTKPKEKIYLRDKIPEYSLGLLKGFFNSDQLMIQKFQKYFSGQLQKDVQLKLKFSSNSAKHLADFVALFNMFKKRQDIPEEDTIIDNLEKIAGFLRADTLEKEFITPILISKQVKYVISVFHNVMMETKMDYKSSTSNKNIFWALVLETFKAFTFNALKKKSKDNFNSQKKIYELLFDLFVRRILNKKYNVPADPNMPNAFGAIQNTIIPISSDKFKVLLVGEDDLNDELELEFKIKPLKPLLYHYNTIIEEPPLKISLSVDFLLKLVEVLDLDFKILQQIGLKVTSYKKLEF